MDLPANPLKRAFREGRPQIGLWSQLTSPTAVELLAGSGFDFLVLDTEHAPNELPMILAQLRAMAEGAASAVVRVAWNDPVLFKRFIQSTASSTSSGAAIPRLSAVVVTPKPNGLVSTSRSPGRAPALVMARAGSTKPITTSPNFGSRSCTV